MDTRTLIALARNLSVADLAEVATLTPEKRALVLKMLDVAPPAPAAVGMTGNDFRQIASDRGITPTVFAQHYNGGCSKNMFYYLTGKGDALLSRDAQAKVAECLASIEKAEAQARQVRTF